MQLKKPIVAKDHSSIYLDFKLSQPSGKSMAVHQVMASLTNLKTGQQTYFVSKSTGRNQRITIDLKSLGSQLSFRSGDYSLELFVGDSFIDNSFSWKIATVSINFEKHKEQAQTPSPYTPRKPFGHIYRTPETRPSKAVSSLFTIAVLSPVVILLFGWIAVGANISNFPIGAESFSALAFQVTLGLILALYGIYWLFLNMIQTLLILTVLLGPFLFFAQKTLNFLSNKDKKKIE